MNFTDSQLEAITSHGTPSMINAGAGSGKTRVIVEKSRRLITGGMPPERVCAITFTKKAAAEMQSRLYQQIGLDAYRAVICNWHSFAYNQILKTASSKRHPYLSTIGYTGDLIILDDGESRTILTECAKAALSPEEFETLKEAGGVKRLQNDMGLALAYCRGVKEQSEWLKNIWRSKKTDREQQVLWFNKLEVWKLYEQRLIELNAVDYDYILVHAVNLLKSDPHFTNWLQGHFGAVLADEHQDCNPVQGMLLKLIVGNGNNLTMVGDEKQSIYAFRAADVGQLLHAKNDYANMKIVSMAQNFRSSPEIINLANGIADLMDESQKVTDGQMATDKPHTGILPVARYFKDDRKEAEFTANEIHQLIQSGQYQAKDIAVLYRAKIIKNLVEDKFIELGVDYQVVGDRDFFDAKEVKDWIAFLRFCCNENDVMAASRCLDAANIGAKGITMRQHITNGKAKNVMDYMQKMSVAGGEKSQSKRQGFKRIIEAHGVIDDFLKECGSRDDVARLMGLDVSHEAVGDQWQAIIADLKNGMFMIWDEVFKDSYVQEAANRNKKDETVDVLSIVAERRKNIEILTTRLFSFLEQFGHVKDCIRELTLLVDSGDNNTDSVQMMTEHASKGLEFKRVYIVGCEDEAHFKSDDANIHEELRLFYVAVTRAEHEVVLSCASDRFVHGFVEKRNPLRFIQALPKDLLRFEDYRRYRTNFSSGQNQYQQRPARQQTQPATPVAEKPVRVDGFKI